MITCHVQSETHDPAGNRHVAEWVSRECFGTPAGFDRYCTMAVVEDGQIIGATVFHNYHPDSGVIELSSAATSKRWLQPKVIRLMFSIPFDDLGCQLVVLRVSERNEGMIRIARRFGFSEWHIPRLRGRDEGEFIFTLPEEAWRAHPIALRGEKG